MEIVTKYSNECHLNQTKYKHPLDKKVIRKFNKKSPTADYFDSIYTYPPKIKIKWDNIDTLSYPNQKVLKSNSVDSVEDWFFTQAPNEALQRKYSISNYLDGFLDRINSSNFFLKRTKTIQEALENIPVFVVENGVGEIVLSQPSSILDSKTFSSYINKGIYNFCGTFNPSIEKKSSIGLFFMDPLDAKNYLKDVARADFETSQSVSLTINCISLDSAYKITREYHPGIDFRFVPNFNEVKKLLNTIGESDLVIENEQQQLRFIPRTINLFPYLKKLGTYISPPGFSFLHKSDYFKGIPIYVVQLTDSPRNFWGERYFTNIGRFDHMHSGFTQWVKARLGFGSGWMMQGSIKDLGKSNRFENYIFFEKDQARQFSKKYGRKVARHSGARTSHFGFMVRKPKIFVYNLEDFLEDWEDKILGEFIQSDSVAKTIFDCKANYFVPGSKNLIEIENLSKDFKESTFKNLIQTLNIKVKVLKRSVGIFFSL